jgi:hypothetical protein
MAQKVATRKRAASTKPKSKPAPEVESQVEVEAPVVPEPEKVQWATHDDLPSVAYRDIDLPVAGRKVRVRFLTNDEIAALGTLPDMANFSALMREMLMLTDVPSPEKQGEITRARVGYIERVAHLCVMPVKGRGIVTCDCDIAQAMGGSHPPTLWSREQVRYLDQGIDLPLICQVAERLEVLERVRPLLQAVTPEGMPEPASFSELTRQETSSETTPAS